jgi:hypothetical protein
MDEITIAAHDFRYLLSRGYPRLGALTFVGNHYQLPKQERDILGRGVYPETEALRRRGKLAGPEALGGRALGVDGHNVLITLENALQGRLLVDCDDGLVRDIAGAAASYRPSEITERALGLFMDYVIGRQVRSVLFLLDAPLSLSGELAAEVNAVMSGRGLMGRARAVPEPDEELFEFTGLVATSDSVLIDRVATPIDLAGHIIREKLSGVVFRSV